jgi:hypothetical protein
LKSNLRGLFGLESFFDIQISFQHVIILKGSIH